MTRTRIFRLLLAALGVGVGVTAWVVWPRGPAKPMLQWYTSAEVAVYGSSEKVRLRLLKPADWAGGVFVPDPSTSGPPPPHLRFESQRSTGPLAALSDLLRRRKTDGEGRLSVTVRSGGYEKLPATARGLMKLVKPGGYEAIDNRKGNGGFWSTMMYTQTNELEFNATYRQICESFQIIRQP